MENFHGLLQTDAYQAYDKVGGSGMVHAGCWTHARRGFANVVKLNPGDPVASPIVARINQLFRLDGEAREQGLSLEARHRLRQQKDPYRRLPPPLPRLILVEGGHQQLQTDQDGLSRGMLDVFCSCSMVRLVRFGKTWALPIPRPEELFEQQDGFHHRTLAKGSKVSKMGRIDFRHQG